MAQMKEFCAELKVGARQTHRNMTLYCPLSADEAPLAGIETLNECLPFREIRSNLVNSYVMGAIETVAGEFRANNRSMRARAATILDTDSMAVVEKLLNCDDTDEVIGGYFIGSDDMTSILLKFLSTTRSHRGSWALDLPGSS